MKKANEMWVGITKIGSETISKGSIKSKKKKKTMKCPIITILLENHQVFFHL